MKQRKRNYYEMNNVSWLFAKNPGHDFTRKSPLSFETMLKLMISMEGQSINKELYNFMGLKTDTPYASAFVQQRNKIDVFACNVPVKVWD